MGINPETGPMPFLVRLDPDRFPGLIADQQSKHPLPLVVLATEHNFRSLEVESRVEVHRAVGPPNDGGRISSRIDKTDPQ